MRARQERPDLVAEGRPGWLSLGSEIRARRLPLSLLAVACLFAPTETRAAGGDCGRRLASYSAGRRGAGQPLQLRHAEGGTLYYFGAVHSLDPGDPQFDRIERAFAETEPTLVFHEGHASAVGQDREATIRTHGEAGLVRMLAARAGLPVEPLEPPAEDEVGYLADRFGPDKVQLFFLLREATMLRGRHRLGRNDLEAAVGDLLANRALPGIAPKITDLDTLDRAFWRHWPYPRRWWQAGLAWFDPYATSASTGGVFTNEIARASAELRDLHMVRVLSRAVLAGERVFAVIGRDHIGMQAPALRCVLE